jgi:carbonic anhydrase
MPTVAAWLGHAEATRRIILDNYADLDEDRLLSAAIEENVLVQLENLQTLPIVASRLVRGDLRLHGWIYEFRTGQVFAYDPAAEQYVPIAEYSVPEEEAAARRRVVSLF